MTSIALGRRSALPVTIIGGYLGAGKTSLINHLLRSACERRIAVLVNEFGALPIDTDLIEAAAGHVLTLSGGCICCSYGDDLITALMSFGSRIDEFDDILVECSGVALPDSVAASLTLVSGVHLQGIVVIVDASNIESKLSDRYVADTVRRQLAAADRLLINKTDLVSLPRLQNIEHMLASDFPRAKIVLTAHGAVDSGAIFGPQTFCGFVGDAQRSPHDLTTLSSTTFEIRHAIDITALAAKLCDRKLSLVRAKGVLLDLDGKWIVLQIVDQRIQITTARTQHRRHGTLVCIAHPGPIDRLALTAAVAAPVLPRQT
ncbi:MAG: GTP-binding protein [Hyphomicrobiaceae bacterium]